MHKKLAMVFIGRAIARSQRRRLLASRVICPIDQWEIEFVGRNGIRPEVLKFVMRELKENLRVDPTVLRTDDKLEDLAINKQGRYDIDDLLVMPEMAFEKEFGKIPEGTKATITIGDYVVLVQRHYAIIRQHCFGEKK